MLAPWSSTICECQTDHRLATCVNCLRVHGERSTADLFHVVSGVHAAVLFPSILIWLHLEPLPSRDWERTQCAWESSPCDAHSTEIGVWRTAELIPLRESAPPLARLARSLLLHVPTVCCRMLLSGVRLLYPASLLCAQPVYTIFQHSVLLSV